MAYTILDNCIGCTACLKRCPVDAIVGDHKFLHYIEPDLCIDCGACGIVCPVEAITDAYGNVCQFVKARTERPIAVVYEDFCTGCEYCVDACPFGVLAMKDGQPAIPGKLPVAYLEKPKDCTACRLCEDVCDKEAIVIEPKAPVRPQQVSAA